MENIIKKAIEGGGYENEVTEKLLQSFDKGIFAEYNNYVLVFFDPLFWQSLGKACGWKAKSVWEKREWLYNAQTFNLINLTEGWDKAVEYLEELVK